MPKDKVSKQKVTFSYLSPDAQSVAVVGDFTGWQQAPIPLKKDKAGAWKKTVSLAPGQYGTDCWWMENGKMIRNVPREGQINLAARTVFAQ